MLRRKCIQLNALRIDGKCTESTNWDEVKQRFAITDRQVLELKSVANEFKRTTTHEYNRAQRDVNHPSNAPIHFAFPEFQTDPNGTTRPTEYDRDITKCSVVKRGNSLKRLAERNGVARVEIKVTLSRRGRNQQTTFDNFVSTRLDRRQTRS